MPARPADEPGRGGCLGRVVTGTSCQDSLRWGRVGRQLVGATVVVTDGRVVDLPSDAGVPHPLDGTLEGWRMPSRRAEGPGWVEASDVARPAVPEGWATSLKRAQGPLPDAPRLPSDLIGGSEGFVVVHVEVRLRTHLVVPTTRLAWWAPTSEAAALLCEALQTALGDALWAADLIGLESCALPTTGVLPPGARRTSAVLLLELDGEERGGHRTTR